MGTVTSPAVGDIGTASWAGGVAGFANNLLGTQATSVSVLSTTTATFLKDSGCGDLTFVVTDAATIYRLTYSARARSDAASTSMDFRILDGGSSSPTAASPAVAGASSGVLAVAPSGATQLEAKTQQTFTVGTHTVAAFYGRTAGAGNVVADQATGQQRLLSVEKLTP